jgi:hypothetical protein
MKKNDRIYTFPSTVLLILGFVNLLRGFLHTFQVNWASTTFAGLNLSTGQNQLFLLGVFGISNFLTGFIYILISRKAKRLSPYILGIILVAYAIGLMGIKSSGVSATAPFYGKYFMLVYLAICLLTFGVFIFKKKI